MISFLVVATPHLLPCPVDPRTLADSSDPEAFSGDRRRRRRRRVPSDSENSEVSVEDATAMPRRPCPVPKPGGLIGQVLGVKKESTDEYPSVTVEVSKARWQNQSEESE